MSMLTRHILFRPWKTFESNAKDLIIEGYGNLKEGYVSLLANIIKEKVVKF